jgi:hypothetical protein
VHNARGFTIIKEYGLKACRVKQQCLARVVVTANHVSGYTNTGICLSKPDLFSEVYFIPAEVSNTVYLYA